MTGLSASGGSRAGVRPGTANCHLPAFQPCIYDAGIPRKAVESKLPIFGTQYTADEAGVYDRNCSWSSVRENDEVAAVRVAPTATPAQLTAFTSPLLPAASLHRPLSYPQLNYGTHGGPAAVAYYESLAASMSSWGVDFVKIDCMWPNRYEGTPQVRSPATALLLPASSFLSHFNVKPLPSAVSVTHLPLPHQPHTCTHVWLRRRTSTRTWTRSWAVSRWAGRR